MNENDCHWCTLFLCKNNLHQTDEYRARNHNKCIVQLIGSVRPIECGSCKIRDNKKLPIEFEKLVRSFQVAEGNIPCFQLAWRCNRKGR